MNRSVPRLARAVVLLTVAAAGSAQDPSGADALLAKMVPQFIANEGQWAESARFLLTTGGTHAWITQGGFLLQCERGELGAAVRFTFADAMGVPVGTHRQPTLRHWLCGDSPRGFVTDVPAYARVVHEEIHSGIDLVLRTEDGHLEYDLVCREGSDLRAVRVLVEGHAGMRLHPDGSLLLQTAVGELRMTPPRTFADRDGASVDLPSRFVQLGEDSFGFAVDGYTGGTLTIDPGLLWGSFLGGSGIDRCNAVAIDSTGATVVVGTTNSANLPTTVGAYRTGAPGGTDAFVAKVSTDGTTLLFCTYLGGSLDETTSAVQVLSSDRIAVAGHTASTNYPVTGNRYQPISAGAVDAFAAVLPATGATLSFSTYYGGTGTDDGIRMFVQPNEDIWLAGRCTGTTPTSANAFQGLHNNLGGGDAFLAILNRTAPSNTTLRFGTYFGGTGEDRVDSLHVMTVGLQELASVGLTTASTNCPTAGTPFQASFVGTGTAGFVLQVDPGQIVGAQTVLYASYLGATGGTTSGVHVERDAAGLFAFAATTSATTWATTPVAFQRLYGGGGSDAIVGRLDPTRGVTGLVLATYYGGGGSEIVEDLAYLYVPGTTDLATIVGSTTSASLPITTSAMQVSAAGTGLAGFVAQLDFRSFLTGQLRYGSWFDGCGAGDDVLHGVARNSANGELTVCGESAAALAPVSGTAFQPAPVLGVEGTVARFDPAPSPPAFSAFGTGCGMPGEIPVLSAGAPPRLCQPFHVNLSNLLPGGGFIVLGFSNTFWFGAVPLPRDLAPHDMPGCTQYVDTYDLYLVIHPGSTASWGLTVPSDPAFYGMDFYLQYLMADARVNLAGLAISNAAALQVRY